MTKQEQLQQYLNGSVLYATIGNNIDIYMINESIILILDHERKGFTIWEANTIRAVGRLHDYLCYIDECNFNDEQTEWFNGLNYWLHHSNEISLYKIIML